MTLCKAWIRLHKFMLVYTVCLNARVFPPKCQSLIHCNISNESFCLQCHAGYYGTCCERTCTYCAEGSACERDSGACKNCMDGCSGAFCNRPCKAGCKRCSINNYSFCLVYADQTRLQFKQECKTHGHIECDTDNCTSDECDQTYGSCGPEETTPWHYHARFVGMAILPAAFLAVVSFIVYKIRCDGYRGKMEEGSAGRKRDEKLTLSSRLEERLEVLDEGPSPRCAKASKSVNGSDQYVFIAVNASKITIDAFEEYVRRMTDEEYVEDFQSLPTGQNRPCTEAYRPENLLKNRYKEIFPYDATRVALKGLPPDYINASYIDGYHLCRAYIACLGPTKKYMGDMSAFWRLVWQENCSTIVMLTKLMEAGVNKCDQYWPNRNRREKYGEIFVDWISEKQFASYSVRTFKVNKRSETRTIRQLHYTEWPDQGVPQSLADVIEFRNTVNDIRPQEDGPLLVHCSAGVGQTGTYIALDILTREGKGEGHVDIHDCVRKLREQRVKMVQNIVQYKFLHQALVSTLCGISTDLYSDACAKI